MSLLVAKVNNVLLSCANLGPCLVQHILRKGDAILLLPVVKPVD